MIWIEMKCCSNNSQWDVFGRTADLFVGFSAKPCAWHGIGTLVWVLTVMEHSVSFLSLRFSVFAYRMEVIKLVLPVSGGGCQQVWTWAKVWEELCQLWASEHIFSLMTSEALIGQSLWAEQQSVTCHQHYKETSDLCLSDTVFSCVMFGIVMIEVSVSQISMP